jgi:hypothetical protein
MESITGVQARIAAIEARFGSRRPVAASDTGDGAAAFDTALASLLAPSATAPAGNAPVTAAPAATVPAATAPAASPGATPAERLAPGQYGALVPPPDLVAYGNGRVPATALAPVGSGPHRLWGPAATAFERLLDAASADGVEIGITDSYRDLATQERLAAEKGLYSQGGLAARPGSSPHGWGLAVDLDLDAAAQAWMRQRGWQFGFVEDVPREPWHWTYRPAR